MVRYQSGCGLRRAIHRAINGETGLLAIGLHQLRRLLGLAEPCSAQNHYQGLPGIPDDLRQGLSMPAQNLHMRMRQQDTRQHRQDKEVNAVPFRHDPDSPRGQLGIHEAVRVQVQGIAQADAHRRSVL